MIRTICALLCLSLSPPAPAAEAIDVEAIARRNMGTVLIIEGKRKEDGAPVQGSGCCISPEGHILATAHQAEGVGDFTGRLADGTRFSLTLIESRPEIEFALFKAEAPLPAHAVLGDARTLQSGAPLVSIAAPMALEFSTVSGTVANPDRTYGGYPVMQVALTATHGSSGGPVFDRSGRLVGLISGGFDDIDFSIVNKINNAFDLLKTHGVSGAPIDGAELQAVAASPADRDQQSAIDHYNRAVAAETLEAKRAAYREALTLWPDFFEARFNLALADGRAGDGEAAVTGYEKAATIRPENVATWRNLGRLHLKAQAFDRAEKAFATAVELAPEDARCHNELGEARRRAGNFDEAITSFERALALDENSAATHYNLALSLAAKENGAAAITHFERYLSLAPDAKDGAEVRAWIEKLKAP